MKSKFFTLFAAFVLLFSANASAQVNGDVNDDGKVNEQDIAAILEIMAEAGGVKEPTKYYWYAGWTIPTAENIATIVNETYPATNTDSTLNNAGGSTTNIDNINADYTTNKLFDSSILTTSTTRKYYVVVPQGCNIYNSIGNISTAFTKHSEFTNHTVYISNNVSAFINAIKIY